MISWPTWVVILANCAIAVLGVLQAQDWIHIVGSERAGVVAVAIAAVNALLHVVTEPKVKAAMAAKVGLS